MQFINDTLLRLYTWVKDESAQTMAEYGLILALVSIAAITGLVLLRDPIMNVFQTIGDALTGAG